MGEQEDSIRLAQEKLSDTLDSAEEDEASYVFTVGQLPPQRQLYYQLCDLRDDRLQELIHCNDGQEITCTVSEIVTKWSTPVLLRVSVSTHSNLAFCCCHVPSNYVFQS